MVIENNINKKTTKAPLKIVYFSKDKGKKKLFFLPIFTKKRESYIIFSKRTIVISKILKNHIKPSDILNNPTKNGIIKIISKHRKDLENIIDVIKIKELKIISKIDNVKKNSLKKDHKNTLFSSMIFSFAKMSEINFPNIDEHLHLFRIISKILIEKIKEKEIINQNQIIFQNILLYLV